MYLHEGMLFIYTYAASSPFSISARHFISGTNFLPIDFPLVPAFENAEIDGTRQDTGFLVWSGRQQGHQIDPVSHLPVEYPFDGHYPRPPAGLEPNHYVPIPSGQPLSAWQGSPGDNPAYAPPLNSTMPYTPTSTQPISIYPAPLPQPVFASPASSYSDTQTHESFPQQQSLSSQNSSPHRHMAQNNNPQRWSCSFCLYCGKAHDRLSRAQDCENRYLGIKPYKCDGQCGVVCWCVLFFSLPTHKLINLFSPSAYSSKPLLEEHLLPISERYVQCTFWYAPAFSYCRVCADCFQLPEYFPEKHCSTQTGSLSPANLTRNPTETGSLFTTSIDSSLYSTRLFCAGHDKDRQK